jgi:hypothetical protein
MAEFKESKVAGDVIEHEILAQIHKQYPKAFTTEKEGKFSDYDIYIPEIKEGIEVKGDYKSAETGNLVIEVEMNGKPSALSVTKAKYWVFVEGYRKIWVKPIDIYRFLESRIYYGRTTFTGDGDNKSKWAYLVNHKEFVEYIYTLKDSKVEMIREDSPIFFDNYSKRFNLMNGNNKTKEIE